MLRRLKPKHLVIICCVFAAFISTAPLLRQALPWAHDLSFHLTRIEGVYQGLLSGQFPVRLNPAFLNGYGYADTIMYPPLFLYFPALLRLLGASPITAYKAFIFAMNLLTAAIAYLCAKRFFRRRDLAVFAMLAYTFCLYRLICIFTRAAVGEIIGMAFLPLVLLGMHELLRGDLKVAKWCLIAGFAGLINCHVLSALIAAQFCLGIALVNAKRMLRDHRLMTLLTAVGATISLTFWVLLPMAHLGLTELRAKSAMLIADDNSVYLAELFATFVKSNGLSEPRSSHYTGMPLSVGGILGLGALVFIYIRLTSSSRTDLRPDEAAHRAGINGAFGVAVVALYMASVLFPWGLVQLVPVLGRVLASVQFPWRYLGVASVALVVVLTFCVAHFAGSDSDARNRNVLLVCSLVVLFAASPYLDGYMQDTTRTAALTLPTDLPSTTVIGAQEYLRVGDTREDLAERGDEIIAHRAEITNVQRDYLSFTFDYVGDVGDYAASGPSYVELPIYYYPLYHAEDARGNELSVVAGNAGVVRVRLYSYASSSHSGTATVRYRAPIAYRLAEIVSLLSILLLTFLLRSDILSVNKILRKD